MVYMDASFYAGSNETVGGRVRLLLPESKRECIFNFFRSFKTNLAESQKFAVGVTKF